MRWRSLSRAPLFKGSHAEIGGGDLGIVGDLYVDMCVPVLARMAAKRRIGYQAIGYKILGTRDLFSGQLVATGIPRRAKAIKSSLII